MGYDIGPRLRKYREAQKLSQKEFAKLIGVSNSRVSNWEQGINRPDVDILAKICTILKVSPSELLDICVLPDSKDEMFVVDNPELSPIEKDLVTKYNSLPLSERKIIDEVVDALLIKYSKNTDEAE